MLGLGQLLRLRVLLMDGNPALSAVDVVGTLRCKAPLFDVPLLAGLEASEPVTTLQSVSFEIAALQEKASVWLVAGCARCTDDMGRDSIALCVCKQATDQKPSVSDVVCRQLVPNNRYLTLLDGVPIPSDCIAGAYAVRLGWTESQRRAYLAQLTLLVANVPCAAVLSDQSDGYDALIRSHAPDDVAPGVQYDPLAVRCSELTVHYKTGALSVSLTSAVCVANRTTPLLEPVSCVRT